MFYILTELYCYFVWLKIKSCVWNTFYISVGAFHYSQNSLTGNNGYNCQFSGFAADTRNDILTHI